MSIIDREMMDRFNISDLVNETKTTTHDIIQESHLNTVTVAAVLVCVLFVVVLMTLLCHDVITIWRQGEKQDGDYEEISETSKSSGVRRSVTSLIHCIRTALHRISLLLHRKPRSRDLIPFTVPSLSGGSQESITSRQSAPCCDGSPPHAHATARSVGGVSSKIDTHDSATEAGLVPGTKQETTPRRVSRARCSLESGIGGDLVGLGGLGGLDPRLYREEGGCDSDEEGGEGRLRFSVQFLKESDKLIVSVDRARHLTRRVSGSPPDPFVRICLLPDIRSQVQSRYRKKTTDPRFDESFCFPVSGQSIEERSLKLSVLDVDKRKQKVIGHVIFSLKGHQLELGHKVEIVRELEQEVTEASEGSGELHVSLCYNSTIERLTVGISEGRNLRPYRDPDTPPDFYVKVSRTRHGHAVKSKCTSVKRRDANPHFNESFIFKVTQDDLDTCSLVITVWQHLIGHKDKSIGRVVLGSFMYARGRELQHWTDMISNHKEQMWAWHQIV